MTVKYRLACFECDIIVREHNDAHQLSIQSRKNPLGNGNRLADYGSEEEAVHAADQLCESYTIAREYGYHLSGGEFVKAEMPSIPVVQLLDMGLTPSGLRNLLNQEALVYGTQETAG
ncbi:hypothetical protein [Cohnella sp. REN36]|uniref:hypothetical protein n=1 Tax=Cohnella sp. REN36 TaxID=2887347 RepID=UPI001D13B9D1|nr:hypothetical protein [Cohnella sp. REN36]MCC3375788.1 hypothetical protein [Cohnella sp. REN36]